jgi:hypothetical protein
MLHGRELKLLVVQMNLNTIITRKQCLSLIFAVQNSIVKSDKGLGRANVFAGHWSSWRRRDQNVSLSREAVSPACTSLIGGLGEDG